MTPQQFNRLRDLQERLTDLLIAEADPSHWPGDGKTSRQMTREERGDRVWTKRGAFATLTIVLNLQRLTSPERLEGAAALRDPVGDAELEKEVESAEREARAILERIQSRGTGKAL